MSIIQGTSKAAGGAGYEIDQSIRFDNVAGVNAGGAQMYRLALTGTPTNDKKATISAWVKRGNLAGWYPTIAYSGDPNGATAEVLRFNIDNTLTFAQASSVYNLTTTQVFRDAGAWYHIVAEIDTANGTSADRANLYVNGVKMTSFSTATYPSLNYVTNWTASSGLIAHTWGSNAIPAAGPSSQLFAGYMADMYVLDGEKAGATAFGEFNDSGVWIPTAYSGAFGNNGYHMTGETASALGDDFSGNNLDFTTVALATTDQMLDTPTNNFCTMNPLDAPTGNITLSNGNLDLSQSSFNTVRGTIAFDVQDDDGFYFEVKKTNGNFRSAGIVATDASNFASAQSLLSVNPSVVYYMEGGEVNQNGSQILASLPTFATNDVLGVAVRNGKVYFAKNNTWVNSGDPVNETGQVASITGSSPLYSPAVGEQDNRNGITNTVNFGATAFAHTPPTGYKALSTANLPTPTIADGSAHFQPTLYTGTGSSQAVSQSGNSTFQPDWVWIKGRSGATEHVLTDAVRGVTKELSTNDAGVEETVAQGLTTFGSAGFTVGTDGSYNTSSATYVGWQWKMNGASSPSANTTAGQSIITYTGTGANASIAHGMGVAPSLVIVKQISDADQNWRVWHSALANTQYLSLDSTNAANTNANMWNSTTPDATNVFLGTDGSVNNVSYEYVMYCFAEIPGYSSFGSYTGNGATDGPFVYTGFKPKWIMYKSSSNAGTRWGLLDTDRSASGGGNSVGDQLTAELTSAEANADHEIDFLSNGFKVRDASGSVNGNGYTITYMAFAENPFGGDGVAPATAR